MPIYLKEVDVVAEAAKFKSALIVLCRFCPAASLSVSSNGPYFEFLRRILKTASYERFINGLKNKLEKKGIKTDVFRSKLLHQFVLCMWTSRRRKQLSETARKYDALVVLGCDAAVYTVRESCKSSACRVIQGMRSEGIMNVRPKLDWPGNLSLDLESVTPYECRAEVDLTPANPASGNREVGPGINSDPRACLCRQQLNEQA